MTGPLSVRVLQRCEVLHVGLCYELVVMRQNNIRRLDLFSFSLFRLVLLLLFFLVVVA